MASNATSANQADFWVKIEWVWSLIFFAVLIISNGVTFLNSEAALGTKLFTLTLSLIYAAWHIGFIAAFRFNPDRYERQTKPAAGIVYILGNIAIWFVLAITIPFFNIILFSLYSLIFVYNRAKFAVPIFILLAILSLLAQVDFSAGGWQFDSPILLFVLLFSVLGGIFLAIFISGIIEQSSERRILIEELDKTRASLAASERKAGVLQERERLSAEIHDTLAQGFISIITHLEASEQLRETDDAKSDHHLIEARRMAKNGLNQTRRIMQDLQPELLEGKALYLAMQSLVSKWEVEHAYRVHLQQTGEPVPLRDDIRKTVFRAVQEGLNNIDKHAAAEQINITLSFMPEMLILDVQDDGIGINQSHVISDGGYGLIGMRQRIQRIGGTLTIESEPNEGTTLVIQVPIETEEESRQ